MSLTKFESEVKLIQQDVESVYERFADMNNLKSLRERLDDPAIKEQLTQRLPEDKIEEARRQLNGMTFDRNSVSLTTPMGNLLLRIVEREAPKCIKFASEGAPPATLPMDPAAAPDGNLLRHACDGGGRDQLLHEGHGEQTAATGRRRTGRHPLHHPVKFRTNLQHKHS